MDFSNIHIALNYSYGVFKEIRAEWDNESKEIWLNPIDFDGYLARFNIDTDLPILIVHETCHALIEELVEDYVYNKKHEFFVHALSYASDQ